MKIYRLPEHIKALIFDMDATLYTHHEYAEHQNCILIKKLADLRNKSYKTMRSEVDAYRSTWSAEHEGAAISLGNTMKAFGISIEQNIAWREELIEPADFIQEDAQLRSALHTLTNFCSLAIVTNNPVSVAKKTLQVLGVEDLFTSVIGLDSFKESKPYAPSFLKAAEDSGTQPEYCAAVGDRYDIDIALPLELGMGGILVDGAEDVYALPEYLKNNLL